MSQQEQQQQKSEGVLEQTKLTNEQWKLRADQARLSNLKKARAAREQNKRKREVAQEEQELELYKSEDDENFRAKRRNFYREQDEITKKYEEGFRFGCRYVASETGLGHGWPCF